jgi:transposase InsO family protein
VLNFIDNYSDKIWVYPLKKKSNTVTKFREWKAVIKKETRLEVKTYCIDNSSRFTSGNFEQYLREAGIRHKVTAPYSSAQNGKAEH